MELIIIILLASGGFLVSLYFTGVYYGYLKSNVWWIPSVCRMEHNTCLSILRTPEARIFGFPNFVLGLIFYVLLIITVTGDIGGFLFDLVLAIAVFTVLLALYLIYALRVLLRTDCILCYTAHGINVCIAIILLIMKYDLI